uniref:EexN family lipoprotein n=1 Tax=Bartonella sp. TT67HLJMS TaxID=3243582 RepID=UPI0035CF0206
ITAGCEKTHSVAEFKKDKNLRLEWDAKCGFAGTSKNCENMRLAFLELQKERQAQDEESDRKAIERFNKKMEELVAKEKAETKKLQAEQEAKERAEREAEERAKAKQQQDSH